LGLFVELRAAPQTARNHADNSYGKKKTPGDAAERETSAGPLLGAKGRGEK